MMRFLFYTISTLLANYCFAQCVIQTTSLKICIGSSNSFSVSPLSATDSVFNWTFGDGGSSFQASPTYQYSSAGTFTVRVRKYSYGGAFCDATPVTVNVVSLPVPSYTRTSQYSQCFETNSFLFTDQSHPGVNNAPIIQRTIVFDDGAFQQEIPSYSPAFNHAYTNPAGGKYKVVLEVKDTNGCISQFIDSVVVYPKMADPDMKVSWTPHCTYSDAVLSHNGYYNASSIQTILWIPGNGDTLYAPLNNLSFRYHIPGIYKPSLIIENKNGCRIKSNATDSVRVVVPPDPKLYFDTIIGVGRIPATQCFKDNWFYIYNPTLGFSSAVWTITGVGDEKKYYPPNQFNVFASSFDICGSFSLKMEMEYFGCKVVADTMIHILGPKAVLVNESAHITNAVQCPPFDTILFRYKDVNCYHNNSSIRYFWDFKDAFAPPCTVDTKAGINVGMNCNFSRDSLPVKHLYSASSSKCLFPYLMVTDSITGCVSRDSIKLRLAQPEAGPDSTAVPPVRGVIHTSGCNTVNFDLTGLVPFCGPEAVFLLPDSSCFPHRWSLVSTLGSPPAFNLSYSGTCSADSMFTFGIVVKNGENRYKQSCYDTAWYRAKYVSASTLKPRYTFLNSNTCKPFKVRFSVPDSIRKDVSRVSWNFGDQTPGKNILLDGIGDTIIKSFDYTYNDTGIYICSFFYQMKNGCSKIVYDTFYFGKYLHVSAPRDSVCLTDSIVVEANAYYYRTPHILHWNDPARAASSKESISWNFGDDNTWTKGGHHIRHKYTKPGIYKITASFKDSTDCVENVFFDVYVFGIEKKLISENDTFFCAPTIVTFTDSSFVVLNDTIYGDQFIRSRLWEFSPLKPASTLQKAVIFYGQNGYNEVKLTINGPMGCKADTTINLVIVGPSPAFVIVEDTFGCAPFTVKLRNETHKQLLNWIWYFNDAAGSTYSTSRDTNVSFTYQQPGVYKIDLIGEDRIYNPNTGSYSFCSEKVPYLADPADFHPRQITVMATDTLSVYAPESVCAGAEFYAYVNDSTNIDRVKWIWGNGETSEYPDTIRAPYKYDTAGLYKINVVPVITRKTQCVEGNERMIKVQFPEAVFTFDTSEYPLFRFINQSKGAGRYLWDFGQPGSSANTSVLENPAHNYGPENKRFKVCLMVFDDLDCMDSVCQFLPLRSSVKIPNVFTPGNGDETNDAFDIDIEGWDKYELFIYNRWGTMVFEGYNDGFENDGVNWNGKDKNTGNDCPEGVYYVVFKYRLFTDATDQVYRGTVTLIRQ